MNKQAGFTLIEIIAVLVILGILAAVAIPKYQDLQEQAGAKAAAGVAAAVVSQMTLQYSKTLLSTNGDTGAALTAATDNCDDITYDSSQFTITCAEGTNGIEVEHTPTGQVFTTSWVDPSSS